MNYRKLGKWGLRVSEVGLGSWLTYGGIVDEKGTAEQVKFAFDQGINFFDTANVYSGGHGEVAVGKALKDLPRHEIVLATKVFFPMGRGPNDKGLSRKHIFEQCAASLQRLQTEYIDLYQCHRFDPDVPIYEVVRAMDDLTRQGKILYWGVSEWSADQIREAVDCAYALNAMPPISNQPQYNMLQKSIENDVIPVSKELGLGQVVFSPLAQGVLTGKYLPGEPFPSDSRAANENANSFLIGRETMRKDTLSAVQRVVQIAEDHGVSMASLALAWCLRDHAVSSVIIGATKISQIAENVKACDITITSDTLAKIDAALSSTARPV
ncbi:MAG TPA: aldo/keto reductase family protein [Oculatellaceae cyanobacterium]